MKLFFSDFMALICLTWLCCPKPR